MSKKPLILSCPIHNCKGDGELAIFGSFLFWVECSICDHYNATEFYALETAEDAISDWNSHQRRLIFALRSRLNLKEEDVSDEELLKSTKGTFTRLGVEIELARKNICSAWIYSFKDVKF